MFGQMAAVSRGHELLVAFVAEVRIQIEALVTEAALQAEMGEEASSAKALRRHDGEASALGSAVLESMWPFRCPRALKT